MITWDYTRDLVTVSYDRTRTSPAELAAVIGALGYRAEAHDAPAPPVQARAGRRKAPVPDDAPEFFVRAFERAQNTGRPLVLDFWAKWCGACLRLKRETLEDTAVAEMLANVELVYIDLDEYPALGGVYGVVAIPDVLFIDGDGFIVDRLHGFEQPEQFVPRVTRLLLRPEEQEQGHADGE